MKINIYTTIGCVVAILILVITISGLSNNNQLKTNSDKPNIATTDSKPAATRTKQECRAGFVLGRYNDWCQGSIIEDFECTDTITGGKGYFACDYSLSTHVTSSVTQMDLKKMSEQGNIVRIEGQASEGYIPCTNDELDNLRQAVCNDIRKTIYIEKLTVLGKNDFAESKAISLLKAAYPEFKSYPNNNLPPQSIRAEKDADGWYVAFVQEGSGRPILGAQCFFVKNDGTIRAIGEFNPPATDVISDFSLKTCRLNCRKSHFK